MGRRAIIRACMVCLDIISMTSRKCVICFEAARHGFPCMGSKGLGSNWHKNMCFSGNSTFIFAGRRVFVTKTWTSKQEPWNLPPIETCQVLAGGNFVGISKFAHQDWRPPYLGLEWKGPQHRYVVIATNYITCRQIESQCSSHSHQQSSM
jgi:hypothetical protein